MIYLGIDPGTKESGWALLEGKTVIGAGVSSNDQLLYSIKNMTADVLALEVFEARGMPIGEDSIETILFTGMLMRAWGNKLRRVRRSEVKLHLCGTSRAKDANVRQALIDLIGAPGTKKNPGPTYGVTSHAWAALAAAYTARGTQA